ncbi:BON domain-containing protein [Methylosinus sp. H3A]|uniref:OmpA family protein n=1 Tax=Methylosinus sp. H3A TaxID=2785786 RepID=UPI0018C25D18|nr:BON domain-containing protein [Methylosinus sp. H3A]MBG0808715.1 BON domain-containing protein [Methylosinus sp. H3A]
MIQPAKWWIGLPVLAVLFTIVATSNVEKIEKDLGDRARAALDKSPGAIEGAAVGVDGRDVRLSGVALSANAVAEAVRAVEGQEGVRGVIDATTPPPLAKPFVFSLERKGKTLALSGDAPLPGERATVRAAAAGKGLELADASVSALGAPKNFAALAAYGVTLLDALGEGRVTVSDAALSVTGAAANFDGYDRAEAALKAPPEGVLVKAAEIAPPRVAPFVWSAAKAGEIVSLFGYAPSEKTREALVAEAANLGKASDQSRVAGGAPGDFAAAATAALRELSKLSSGKASISDGVVSIEGSGKTNIGASAIEASLRVGLPKSFRLGQVAVAAGAVSPFVFTARKQDGALSLAGFAPDAAARARIVAQARRDLGEVVEDELSVADGAPKGFAEAAIAALRALARLDAGVAALSDRKLALEGAAFNAKAQFDISARLFRDLPEGYENAARLGLATTTDEIPPTRLYAALAETAARGLSFGADNSIAETSLPVVDSLAFVLLRSPGAAVDIVGRFAGAGSDLEDEAIGLRRAEAVRNYLIEAGVEAARLSASGAAAADKSGRRIEFSIR